MSRTRKTRNFIRVLYALLWGSAMFFLSSYVAHAQERDEGWIVRQTQQGLVKVPARQYFRFEGLTLNGKAYAPFQAVFDQRPSRKNKSLIPVRSSFRRELIDASGYSGR